MNPRNGRWLSGTLLVYAALGVAWMTGIPIAVSGATIEFSLQTRDRETGRVLATRQSIDPKTAGVVIVDMWNTNDCMTNAQRAAALVPRMNKALEGARRLGMQIIWAPTDVASQYAGAPQRERAIALPRSPLPHIQNFSCPFRAPTVRPDKCMCGPGIVCHVHYGWDSMDPNLVIAAGDWIAGDAEELYAIYKHTGLTRLLYMGINTNLCVMNKPEGIAAMTSAGLQCILARDLTDAETSYEPDRGFTPDTGTETDVADVERSGVPTVNMAEEMRKAGVWNDRWIVETVRLAPWGTTDWPYEFTDAVRVTLSTPQQKGVEIRYTLDGTEPHPASPLYTKPLDIAKTARLRTAAFENGRLVTTISEGYFARLGPLPPKPDLYLDELNPVVRARPDWRWKTNANRSFTGEPLTLRDVTYANGAGTRAPSNLLYEIQPDYDRFVARAGVDEEPWRFDVKIPAGGKLINLVVTDAGSRSPLDLADWVDAGFVRKK